MALHGQKGRHLRCPAVTLYDGHPYRYFTSAEVQTIPNRSETIYGKPPQSAMKAAKSHGFLTK
jgi:hypothetical protein